MKVTRDKISLVSIIIPVRNEEKSIEENIRSILAQDYPLENIEVLIVDGHSTDRTREIVSRFADANSNVHLLDNPARFTPNALNIGLRNATGDTLIIMSGHAVMSSNYVSSAVWALENHEIDAVGGWIETIGETRQAKAIALAMSSRFGVGDVSFRIRRKPADNVDTIVFGAYRREIVEQVGLFDEELVRNQDDEYNYRLRKLGGRLMFSPEIVSRYYSRGTIRALFRQYLQYGYYKVRVLQKHPAQMRPRQFVPPLFVLNVLVGAVLAYFSKSLRRLWQAGIAAYALANISASVKLAQANGWQHFIQLPLVFFILHFSYGLGFLAGLVHFRDRWGR